jgi:hypothetical protein
MSVSLAVSGQERKGGRKKGWKEESKEGRKKERKKERKEGRQTVQTSSVPAKALAAT